MNSKETPPETEFVSILGTGEKTDVPTRFSSRSLPEKLPILGLSDIVIFPGAVVPLLVETGPSLKLVDDLVAGDRLLGAVLQRNPDVAEPGAGRFAQRRLRFAPDQDGEVSRRHRARAGGGTVAHPHQVFFPALAVSARRLRIAAR